MLPAFVVLLEVMDKEPTLTRTWLTFLALGAAAELLGRRWRWTLWLSVPVSLFFAWIADRATLPAALTSQACSHAPGGVIVVMGERDGDVETGSF